MKNALLAMLCILALVACSEAPPPVRGINVVVDEVKLEPYRPKSAYVGRLEAKDDVTITAQVTGYLLARGYDRSGYIAFSYK